MEQLALPHPMAEHDARATLTSTCPQSIESCAPRKRRALTRSEPTRRRARQRTNNASSPSASVYEDQNKTAATAAAGVAIKPTVHADRGLAATCPLPMRSRPPRRIHPMARIVQRAVQYVCVGGRQLAVVDVAIALVVQATQGKPGSCDTLLAQSWSLQDSALAVHGMCARPGSVVVLTATVAPPASAPPPFTAMAPSRSSERTPLAYTTLGLFWLFGVLRSHGDPRFHDAMGAVLRSGVIDDIGARLELAPVTARASFSCTRAVANIAVVLVDDRCGVPIDASATADTASAGDLDNGTNKDKGTDLCMTTPDHVNGNDNVDNVDKRNINVCVLSVAAAAMRNELCGADPWAIMGQGDRRRVVGSDSREACALLAATGACLARRGVAARLLVDAVPGPRVDDARFRHHVEAAFGFVAP
ncbi:hypothetical protein pqer_cds_1066 [Pandoravirus quercus]|uniref:Uncharacterized protein n=1 Tax=Pandoravirus quercus TaxID=2107709 RepID=A0A2U7UAL1_9VIRU|nr:hypothetical protein pqer_cds_1066 [Pandoravirus quercus]AVK75488.1 hypothetical protein pqer_cds_1066 [Pandoravirus quercus]